MTSELSGTRRHRDLLDHPVSAAMTHEPVCVTGDMTIRALAQEFDEHDISGAPVVGPDGRLVGVVSKTDVIRRCAQGVNEIPPAYLFEMLGAQSDDEMGMVPESLLVVQDFMTEDPITAKADEPLRDVIDRMVENRIHRVIIVDREQCPIGVLTTMDALRAVSGAARHESRD